jgi:hypothetical protein
VRLATTCALIGFSSIGVAACGDDGERSGAAAPGGPGLTTTDAHSPDTAEVPQATETTPAATATPSASTGATGPAGTTTTEIGPQAGEEEGGGDAEAARVPADFRVGAALEPSRITVPAFLTIALSARSADGRAHTLRLTTPRGPVTLAVPAGGSASKDIEGLPAGEYLIAVDGQPGDSALVVGGEPGP